MDEWWCEVVVNVRGKEERRGGGGEQGRERETSGVLDGNKKEIFDMADIFQPVFPGFLQVIGLSFDYFIVFIQGMTLVTHTFLIPAR